MRPSSISADRVQTRPVVEADEALIDASYASGRADELAAVPWSEEQKAAFLRGQSRAQCADYHARNPGSRHEVVLVDGAPAGRLWIAPRAEELRLLDLTLLPQFRNAGVGTELIGRLQREAQTLRRPLTAMVETFARSRPLFERLGFVATAQVGFHLRYAWTPTSGAGG